MTFVINLHNKNQKKKNWYITDLRNSRTKFIFFIGYEKWNGLSKVNMKAHNKAIKYNKMQIVQSFYYNNII